MINRTETTHQLPPDSYRENMAHPEQQENTPEFRTFVTSDQRERLSIIDRSIEEPQTTLAQQQRVPQQKQNIVRRD
jgi:hypothetical protein